MQAEDARTTALRQYAIGAYNRRVAKEAEQGKWHPLMGSHVEVFCTCGRADCDEILWLTPAEYDEVRAKPYRFVVAPGHDDEIDDVLEREVAYWVVEVKPEYRLD